MPSLCVLIYDQFLQSHANPHLTSHIPPTDMQGRSSMQTFLALTSENRSLSWSLLIIVLFALLQLVMLPKYAAAIRQNWRYAGVDIAALPATAPYRGSRPWPWGWRREYAAAARGRKHPALGSPPSPSRLVLWTINRWSCTIMEKAPTRAFSWLKALSSLLTLKI